MNFKRNALQARFLNQKVCQSVVEVALPRIYDWESPPLEEIPTSCDLASRIIPTFEKDGFPVRLIMEVFDRDYSTCYRAVANMPVELAPGLGDDYPEVLASIRKRLPKVRDHTRDDCCFLYVGDDGWTGESITQNEVELIFCFSDVQIVWSTELQP